jgi:hypothetical protein
MVAAVLVLCMLPANSPTPAFRPDQVIEYTKQLDVSKLDPRLASERLAAWISRNFSVTGAVRWRTGDCELVEPPSAEGYPLCVDFFFDVGRVKVWGTIIVGLYDRGISGRPQLDGAHVQSPGLQFESCMDLGSLPALVSRLAKRAESPAPTPREDLGEPRGQVLP